MIDPIAKKYDTKELDAVTWIKCHPEDIPLARENLRMRDKGFDTDGFRQMLAAVCLRACVDYKFAMRPHVVNTKIGQKALADCRQFFEGEIFQFFVNGMSVDDICKALEDAPEDEIKNVYKRIGNSAKNTTPIIEEQCDEQGSLFCVD